MSYIDAFYDRDQDQILVVERDEKGQRHFKEYSARHIFYYKDPRGKYTSIYGESLSRASCKNIKELRKELAINSNKKLYESDINPIYRCLEDNYLNVDAPKLNVAWLRIAGRCVHAHHCHSRAPTVDGHTAVSSYSS
jgi:hypothetical protein